MAQFNYSAEIIFKEGNITLPSFLLTKNFINFRGGVK